MSITHIISPMEAPPAAASVLSAYEKFEAARLEYLASYDQLHAVTEEVETELAPQPSCLWPPRPPSTPAEEAERGWWLAQRRRRVTARLGVGEDEFWHAYRDRMERAYEELTAIPASTIAELLCQVRAWWNVDDNVYETEVPERLAGEARL